ncbi:hypothetical protein BU24DRAFT_360606 [Aaosphaeria arxii CBS 175.79]|uniref:DUF1996 domain-containing protein n=1 Tax=Aaosphaeria arxii CBS 175.79 TaxID=1450172 RepID=A0A6A5X635_9PLEO|nr:uncharacterized protein BU24DRAFT_360606 [Aaosphaeria arxii CBS 175.79]KAF2008331.1 hypothetical protein BU24DRAFT_360606 [Aaosphaeria arxii CBS 175.79]
MYLVKLLLTSLLQCTFAFWRLPCYSRLGVYRIDPIVSPGKPSEHAHVLHGANGLHFNASYSDLIKSNCTTCAVRQDMSVYWTPPLMFEYPNKTTEIVPQTNGMTIYYFLFGQKIREFPDGFRMVAGDSKRRTSTIPVTDPPRSLWGFNEKQQDELEQRALGFNCLNYGGAQEGALERHTLPDKAFIDECPDGLRLELMFPSCWDGRVDSFNHKEHLKYPDLLMEGECPDGFMLRVPSLYYETIWDTARFRTSKGRFLLSNGDETGTSYHGDFLNGWKGHTLRDAIHSCTSRSGRIEECSIFHLQAESIADKCDLGVPAELQQENCLGPQIGLCGQIELST